MRNDFEGWDEYDDDEDEKDDGVEEDDLTLIAAATIIEKGNVDAAERQLRKDHELSVSESQDLCAEGLLKIMGSAPREIRQSFEATVAWHRWNAMYQQGVKKKNNEIMVTAQKQMDALMARVH